MMVVQGQRQLLEPVAAGRPPGRLACRLHGRQQQPHERADDGDDNEQLHEREAFRDAISAAFLVHIERPHLLVTSDLSMKSSTVGVELPSQP